MLFRWDMTKPEDCYCSGDLRRTLEEMKAVAGKTKNFGCLHQPLLNIPLSNIRVDELHLLLRITGTCLLQSVIRKGIIQTGNFH